LIRNNYQIWLILDNSRVEVAVAGYVRLNVYGAMLQASMVTAASRVICSCVKLEGTI